MLSVADALRERFDATKKNVGNMNATEIIGTSTDVACCPRNLGGTECSYYVMKFMKEIAYEGVEILDNDNVGKRVEEYSAADIDGIFIF
ncbi:hypothetical protein Hanom_Chr12g01163401 [Helianthus anomalus]